MNSRNNYVCTVIAGLAVLATLYLYSCSGNTQVAGSGTGVGNAAISGTVIYADSTPVSGALVRLREQNYLHDTSVISTVTESNGVIDCTTDSAGEFKVDSLAHGSYFIEIIDEEYSQGTLIRLDYADTGMVVLAPRVVSPVTKITGTVTVAGLPKNAWVQMYGIEIVGKTDANGHFTLENLPLGDCSMHECEFTLRILTERNGVVVGEDYELEIEWTAAGMSVEIELEDD